MSIGILYESNEWSNHWMCELFKSNNIEAEMIHFDVLNKQNSGELLHTLYINRIFPSADMRNHNSAIEITDRFLFDLTQNKIPVINSYEAFLYDCSKKRAYDRLVSVKLPVPDYEVGSLKRLQSITGKSYPLVLKPDCGGRSYQFHLLRTPHDIHSLPYSQSDQRWILQDYVNPSFNFTTRIEIVGSEIMTILKRFLGKGGVSSYSQGSQYELYHNCPDSIIADSFIALKTLSIEMGSLDFIENEKDGYFLIDVNATSNFTPDYNSLLGFDPIERMVNYVIKNYSSYC